MNGRLPLPTLLSSALVAFTIEFDNEYEHRVAHRTTRGATTGPRDRVWLVSLPMWPNCMEHVGEDGVTVAELRRLARTTTNLAGMQRWGFIAIDASTVRNPRRPGPDALVRSTRAGRAAQELWRPLFGVIEGRWQARFGQDNVERLAASLRAVAKQLDPRLPDCLPILRYGLWSGDHDCGDLPTARPRAASVDGLALSALLSRVLLAFAIDYERESNLSLAIGANVLRVLDGGGIRIRDLPILTGLSKESISMAMGILEKGRFATVGADSAGGRSKVARLTTRGQKAQDSHHQLVETIEGRWVERFGEEDLRALRSSLDPLVGDATSETSPLFHGLDPYPEGWRAAVQRPGTLAHFPTVLHRGGYPDGS